VKLLAILRMEPTIEADCHLDNRLPITLLTTTVFVLGFGIIVAIYWEGAQNRDIITATASYAMALIMFIGRPYAFGQEFKSTP
jgi:hypothetical protein